MRVLVEEAKTLSEPILIDTLPALLESLAETLSTDRTNQLGSMDSTLAHEHGGERARLTNFNLSALIMEFRILRQVIIRTLRELDPNLDPQCEILIHIHLDESIQSSAMAFSLVQASLRDQMVATLSHDMRSPLTAATLAVDVIRAKSTDEATLRNVRKIKVNHRRIDNLIQDLLNTSLIRAGGKLELRPEAVNVRKLLSDIYDVLPVEQEQRLHVQSPELEGWWDADHLRRALENLVSNAFKYGDRKENVSIDVAASYGRVIFSVHNHGAHIPKEEQETIFQVFRRAEAAKNGKPKGWGLGLPMVRAVAEAHAGSITVDSYKDSGTTFLLDVPQDVRPFCQGKVSKVPGTGDG